MERSKASDSAGQQAHFSDVQISGEKFLAILAEVREGLINDGVQLDAEKWLNDQAEEATEQ